jgi:ElaB/YqjD/DUF883 family membrane-anchored ribosome-binding protein
MKPTITKRNDHLSGEEHSHPAFGLISLTKSSCSGSGVTLYGSDIGHTSTLHIKIMKSSLTRSLSNDWFGHDEVICDFEISHAQFARFITSVGDGNGTPITLRQTQLEANIPHIDKIETKYDTHKKEIKASAVKAVADFKERIDELDDMLNGDKAISKKQLKELHQRLKCSLENFPSSLEFSIDQAVESLEKATSDAKIEVDSFIAMASQRIGLDHINQSGELQLKLGQDK